MSSTLQFLVHCASSRAHHHTALGKVGRKRKTMQARVAGILAARYQAFADGNGNGKAGEAADTPAHLSPPATAGSV